MDTGHILRGEKDEDKDEDSVLWVSATTGEGLEHVRYNDEWERELVSYRSELYKSNTVVQGGSTMSELDLDKKLEVGDLLVGECRCDPSKKGIVEVVVGDSRGRVLLRFPSKCALGLFDGGERWEETVGGAISFIREATFFNTTETHKNYHNWKHIPKRDFTFEVGDILYGECACTPSKFVVFEVYGVREKFIDLEVVDSWNEEHLKITQNIWPKDVDRGESLNQHCRRVLSNQPPYNFNQYNYIKYTKAEWQKRCASKFIVPGQFIEAQEPREYTFKKSDYKVIETDKEIRVAPRVKNKVDVVVLHRALDFTRDGGGYVVVRFVLESEKHARHLLVREDRRVREETGVTNSSYLRKVDDEYFLHLEFHRIEGALKTHKETEPILLPRAFYDENIEDIKQALKEYLEQ